MKGPICEICANSGFLCKGCEEKLRNGQISQLDVEIFRILSRLERKGIVENVEFDRTIEEGEYVFLIAHGRIATLIGRGGRIVRLLSEKTGRKVRIIGHSDPKGLLQDLLSPARLFGLNVVYAPEGESLKAIVNHNERKKIKLPTELIEKVSSNLLGKKVELTFV